MDHTSFDSLSRDELISRARAVGVDRPELMTRVELADELVRRSEPDPVEQRRVRGWLGVARDLVASVVESGLNLPDTAKLIRGGRGELEQKSSEPVATVTLAEIYATQGHAQKALQMLEQVLAVEPEHEAARRLRERLEREQTVPKLARKPAASVRYEVAHDAEFVEVKEEPSLVPLEPLASQVTPPAPRKGEKGPAKAAVPEPEGEEVQASVVFVRGPGLEPVVSWELHTELPEDHGYVIVCVAFVSTPDGVERSELVIPVAEARGRAVIESITAGSVVRVALGVEARDRFRPLVIASEVRVEGPEITLVYRPPLAPSQELSKEERALVTDAVGR